jgi:hypothetical protein
MAGDSLPQWMQNLIVGMIRANLPTFFVILLLMAGVLWLMFNWAYGAIIRNQASEIKSLERQKAEASALRRPGPALPMAAGLIKDPHVDWDSKDRISLRGRFTRSGGPLTVYVTYGQTGGDQRPVIGGSLLVEPRIKIGSLAHFDHDEPVNVAIGHVMAVEGNQQVIQWGEPEQNNTKVGITWGSYFGSIIFVSPDGGEEPYSFAIVSKSQQGKPASPLVIGPDVLQTIAATSNADNPVKR